MRRDNDNFFRYVDNEDKYCILINLYNDWNERTWMLSCGNTNVEEWDKMLEYCKQNKTETAHFFLDLIDCYEEERKEGTRDDNFVGFFNDIIGIVFEADGIPTFKGFVGGKLVQATYKIWIEECFFGDKDNLNWIDKIRILTK